MKLSSRTVPTFFTLLLLGMIIGTFSWEILERLLSIASVPLDLRVGPVGFDTGVLSVRLMLNPGSLAGLYFGHRTFVRT
ncbi:MAG: hypothetical protein ACLFM0_00190 [Spirochaetales bacterium]